MPSVTVHLPATLTAPRPTQDILCEGETVRDALEDLARRLPWADPRVFYEERLLVTVARNGTALRPSDALATPLAAGDRLDLIPPVAGG
jgi:molybdopterin converting factor small subunit